MAAACQVQKQVHEMRLRALELQVLAHGGTLVSQLPDSSAAAAGGITHIVVCPPAELAAQHAQHVEQQQQLLLQGAAGVPTAEPGTSSGIDLDPSALAAQQAAADAAKHGPALPADALVSELVALCPAGRLRDMWALKQQLLAGRVAMVTPAWVQDSVLALREHNCLTRLTA
jgi:hypothetical protein